MKPLNMFLQLRMLLSVCIAGGGIVIATKTAQAATNDYPNRPIRWLTPAPPGGSTDFLSRIIAPRLADAMKCSIVIDNRGGAGGVVAAEITARAPADGYTLLMAYSSHTTNVSLNPQAGYRAVDDYAPVVQVTSAPLVLVVNPQMPVNSVRELMVWAKANPGKLNVGSAGNGSGAHMALELFKYMTGLPAQHIPYKGMGPSVIDLLGGQIQAMFAGMLPIQSVLRAGRVRALAVTSLQRVSALPEVPTIAETGVPGYEVATWYGVLAPAGTPKPVVDRLNREIVAILQSPDVKQRLQEDGANVIAGTPAAFEKMMRSELDKWAKVVKATGAHLD